MKEYSKRVFLGLLTIVIICFASCKDDNEKGNEGNDNYLEESYISIENGKYHSGNMPNATTDDILSDVEMSDQVMNGAVNYITVTTSLDVATFFIGIDGIDGYLEYKAENSRASSDNIYVIPLMIAQNFSGNADLVLSAKLTDGSITIPSNYPLYQLETRPGALEIKLAFSNDKDVDIHLFTPSGMHICYWSSEDGYYFGEDEDVCYPFGLDIDSNAGCDIDGINKENIYIPEEYVENGVYRVAVDLYENCNPRIPTSWSVTARYNGNLITPISGINPASGVFEIGAKSSYEENLIDVMTFKITGATQSRAILDSSRKNTKKKSELHFTENQKRKIRMAN